jgi:molybdopterin-guanine dinucleotide biosynthesis protein A
MEEALHAGKGRVVSFFDKVKVHKVGREEVARFDPAFRSFRNINTPEDYFRFRETGKSIDIAESGGPQPRKDQG